MFFHCLLQTDSINKYCSFFKFQLDKPVKPTKTVQCLKLGNTVKEPAAGTNCQVAGWGKTTNIKGMSDVLMSVNVTVIDRAKCNSPDYYNLNPVIMNSMICAGSDGKNTADTCQVNTLYAGNKQPVTTTQYHHFNCYELYCMCLKIASHVFILSLGGFWRATVVQWSTSGSHFFWKEVWPDS